MKIKISPRATKSLTVLAKSNKNAARLVDRKIAELAEMPFPPGATKLRDQSGDVWRIKAGAHHRIVYTVDEDAGILEIINAAHRAKIYKSLPVD